MNAPLLSLKGDCTMYNPRFKQPKTTDPYYYICLSYIHQKHLDHFMPVKISALRDQDHF